MTAYEETLGKIVIRSLTKDEWDTIERIPWRDELRHGILYFRHTKGMHVLGRIFTRKSDHGTNAEDIVREMNETFKRENLPYRIKPTTNMDPEDDKRMFWGFQIGILSEES